MKFKVGDKVINRIGFIGKVQEVLQYGCFVNYGYFADYEFNCDLRKPKKITFAQANRDAEKEKKAEIQAQCMTKLFCEYLSKI